MIIQYFSKDSKRGFAVGSNSMTPEKLAAGLIAAAFTVAAGAIGGLFAPKKPASKRAGSPKKAAKKRKALPLLAAPLVFKAAKSAAQHGALAGITSKFSAKPAPEESEIEIENAIPISSEDEIYEHI